ncbi:MAG: ATP-binding protein [Lachnospiraceae bacterium]|nr:ATP-binding protein [Lachnospiraceae bacterium]
MLKKFTVKGYRNFIEEVTLDFGCVGGYQFNQECIYNGIISKMIVYGKSAVGKTNFGRAISDITTNFDMIRYGNILDRTYVNADSKEKYASFSYTFQFESDELIYEYTKYSANKIRDEKLYLNGEKVFWCDFELDEYDFENLHLVGAETAIVEQYIASQKLEEADDEIEHSLTFMRWVINNVALTQDNVLLKLNDYVKRMSFISTGKNAYILGVKAIYERFCEYLDNERKLDDFEEFLNVMGIKCELTMKKLPDGQRELYFQYSKTLVPFFENASSGTLSLVSLYRRIVNAKTSSLLFMDEFDAFYHYEMSDKVVRFMKKKYPQCQIIMTSHNTNLISNRLMRPDCLFILSEYGLTPLNKATERELREGHNLEKMYISGEFEKYE